MDSYGWATSWPPPVTQEFDASGGARWVAGLRPFYRYRDLCLATATGGAVGARHVRAIAPEGTMRTGWHCHGLAFQFIYVLSGAITLEPEGGPFTTLVRGDAGHQPPYMWHDEYDLTADYEVIEITAPADVTTIVDREVDAASGDAGLADRRPVYLSSAAAEWHPTASEDRLLAWDLDTNRPTRGRVAVRVLKAVAPIDRTMPWVTTASARFLFVLDGSSELTINGGEPRTIRSGDAMTLPIGQSPELRGCSSDFCVLDVALPDRADKPE